MTGEPSVVSSMCS